MVQTGIRCKERFINNRKMW